MTATSHEQKWEGSAHQIFENPETLFLHTTTLHHYGPDNGQLTVLLLTSILTPSTADPSR